MATKKAKAQPEQPAPTMDPAPDAADMAKTEQADGCNSAFLHHCADEKAAQPAPTGPVFSETDLGRVQALPDLSEAPEGAEATIPAFAPGAIQFFKASDGATCRVVCCEGKFYSMEHVK